MAFVIGKGTTIGYADTGVAAPTALAQVLSTSLPKLMIPVASSTHYGSTFEGKIPVLIGDVENVTVNSHWDKTQYVALKAFQVAGTSKFWTITLADATTYKFEAFILDLGGGEIVNKDTVKLSLTLCVTTTITVA